MEETVNEVAGNLEGIQKELPKIMEATEEDIEVTNWILTTSSKLCYIGPIRFLLLSFLGSFLMVFIQFPPRSPYRVISKYL